MRDAHERGQGIVIATAHMGAFDLLGHAIAAQGVPMTVITGRTTSRFMFDGGDPPPPLAPDDDGRAGSRRRAPRYPRSTPGRDRRVSRRLRFFPEWGADDASLAARRPYRRAPIRIARDTGALVVPMFPRRGPRGHELSVGEPFEVPKTADIDADVASGMEVLKSRLEAGIGANPDQWVLFQRAWPLAPAPPVRVFPVGSPLESELLKRVDAVAPATRDGRSSRREDAPTGRMDPPPRSRDRLARRPAAHPARRPAHRPPARAAARGRPRSARCCPRRPRPRRWPRSGLGTLYPPAPGSCAARLPAAPP